MLHRIIGEDIVLDIQYSPVPAMIEADEDMLGQILMNLAVNARDAMPKGGKLAITTEAVSVDAAAAKRHAEAWPGEFICLSVSDNGCGIRPEILARVFEPFFTTKSVGQGTGLGLSTVYGIVKQHRGWIEVASQVGSGTTFRIFLPRLPSSITPSKDSATPAWPKGGSETILLVEDEMSVRQLTQAVLQRQGYRVLEAASGLEAVAIWHKHADEIDLVLTDLVMPGGLAGRELAEKLRNRKPDLKIIFTTGYSHDKGGVKDTSLDDTNFLQKPYRPQKLAQIVRDCLDHVRKLPATD